MSTDQATIFADDCRRACETMRRGGVILYPTDTIWGIGCDARQPEAIEKVYAIKRRQESKSLIMLVDSPAMIQRYATLPESYSDVLADTEGRPLTTVLSGVTGLPGQILASDGSAAFRVSREPFSAMLCRMMDGPVVSTSANFSGAPSPTCFDEIPPGLIAMVDYVAMTGRRPCKAGTAPSRIIKFNPDGSTTVLRQ